MCCNNRTRERIVRIIWLCFLNQSQCLISTFRRCFFIISNAGFFLLFLSYGRCLLSYLVTSFFFSWQCLLPLQMGGSLGDPGLHLLCTGCHFPCHGDTSWGWVSPIHQVTKANGEFGEKWLFENDVTKTVMEASNCLDYIILNELGSLLA